MVIKRDFWYWPAQQDRRLHIYLPEGYEGSEEHYPVMYFFDGHNLFFDSDATYGKSWGLKDYLDHWDKPMIIVGMECGHDGFQRLSEYNPYKVNRGFYSHAQVLGDATFHWLMDEVKPMVDREYRTYADRRCTGVAGSSMGGMMALYGILRYNHCFSKAACLSSAIAFCMPQFYQDLRNFPVDADTRVYLSWGTLETKDTANDEEEDLSSYASQINRSLASKLQVQGAAVQVYCQIGGRHCEADWEKQVPLFMEFLWKNRFF